MPVVVDVLGRLDALVLGVVTVIRREGSASVLILHREGLAGRRSVCGRGVGVAWLRIVVICCVVVRTAISSHPACTVHGLETATSTTTGVDASMIIVRHRSFSFSFK